MRGDLLLNYPVGAGTVLVGCLGLKRQTELLTKKSWYLLFHFWVSASATFLRLRNPNRRYFTGLGSIGAPVTETTVKRSMPTHITSHRSYIIRIDGTQKEHKSFFINKARVRVGPIYNGF